MLAKKSKETTPGSASIPEKKAVVFGAWNRNSSTNQMMSTTFNKTQVEIPLLFNEEGDFPSLDSAIKENPVKKEPVVFRYRLKSAYQQSVVSETMGKDPNDDEEDYEEEEGDSDD